MVSAVMSLQALLLAFTFSSAGSNYKDRAKAISDEADAFRVLWLRSMDLPPDEAVTAQSLIREVFEARAELIASGASGTSPRSLEARRNLFFFSMRTLREHPDSAAAKNFDLAIDKYPGFMARVAAEKRIPPLIWLSLYFLTLLGMIPLGYHSGLTGLNRPDSLVMIVPLIIAFSLVLVLIADLDSPTKGAIRTGSTALDDVRRLIYLEVPTYTTPPGHP
jgi:hypothetical protein